MGSGNREKMVTCGYRGYINGFQATPNNPLNLSIVLTAADKGALPEGYLDKKIDISSWPVKGFRGAEGIELNVDGRTKTIPWDKLHMQPVSVTRQVSGAVER